MNNNTKICFIVILACLYILISDGYILTRPRVFSRIPKFFVYEKLENFLKYNGINDCFFYEESEINLLMKCLKNNRLVDVDIMITDTDTKKIISAYI